VTQEGATGRFRATVLRGNQVARELPGDDLLANPDIIATRAVAIDAPPGAVWPWLVQMGSGGPPAQPTQPTGPRRASRSGHHHRPSRPTSAGPTPARATLIILMHRCV